MRRGVHEPFEPLMSPSGSDVILDGPFAGGRSRRLDAAGGWRDRADSSPPAQREGNRYLVDPSCPATSTVPASNRVASGV